MTLPSHSPAPWGYEYSPYTVLKPGTHGDKQVGDDIPAYEIFDAEGKKVFDTNEDTPCELQEANACLGAAAPTLLAALRAAKDTIETLLNGDHYQINTDAGIELSGLEGTIDAAIAEAIVRAT